MDDNSNAGGVAARQGFKYQDHVAALFVLKMIGDRRLLQVECETKDDITLVWSISGRRINEYIQVKTTDKDTKWNKTEITARERKADPTSLIEKSLLCDKDLPNPLFRLVSLRGVAASLKVLREPIVERDPNGQIATLAASLKAKFRNTISANNNDLAYWTRNAEWDVYPSRDSLETKNLQTISRLAEDDGFSPTYSQTKAMYGSLLSIVDRAALEDRRRRAAKTIMRDASLSWWAEQRAIVSATQRAQAKPYRTAGPKFFVTIHDVDDATLRRASSGYDAQYERKIWRSKPLAQHLFDWLPEVTLKASELVEIDQLNLRMKLEAGAKAAQAYASADARGLIGETLLHAVLRHWFTSEPIACKLFHRSPLGDRVTRNAHIVHSAKGDELWLGRAHLFSGDTLEALADAINHELRDAMDTEVLREERDVILQLRQPQHLTANTLDVALERGSPIDELIRVLCLPVLVAYDSPVLHGGHRDDYQEHLTAEVETLAEQLKANLPTELDEVRAHIFLVPIESVPALVDQFREIVGLQ